MLARVEHDEQPPPLKVRDDGVERLHARLFRQFEHGGQGDGDQLGVAQRAQLDEPHPVREPLGEPGRGPHRRTTLADAARSHQGDEAGALEPGPHLGQFVLPADERGYFYGELTAPPLPEPETHELRPRRIAAPLAHHSVRSRQRSVNWVDAKGGGYGWVHRSG